MVKVAVMLLVLSAILLLTYDLLVRSTVIGKVLNGRTYPRGLPRLEGSGAPVGLTPEPAQARRDSTRS